MQAEAGVVVQAVDDPGLLASCKRDLGGIDLPEVVGRLALEALVGPRSPPRLGGDQVVAAQCLVHGRDRRGVHPSPAKLGADPARPPARMAAAQLADLRLLPSLLVARARLRSEGAGVAVSGMCPERQGCVRNDLSGMSPECTTKAEPVS